MHKNLKFLFYILSIILISTPSVFAGINMKSKSSAINLQSGTTFTITTTISNFSGKLIKSKTASINGSNLQLNDAILEEDKSISIISGTYIPSSNVIWLDGNESFWGAKGELLYTLKINGHGNYVGGNLNTNNDLELLDENSTFTTHLINRIEFNIKLNNGTIILEENLNLYDNKKIIGPGTIDLNGHKLIFGARELILDEPIYFQSAADIEFNSLVHLTTTYTFNDIGIISGNANILCLHDGGNIVVNSNSTLIFKDIIIQNISENNIRCVDDSANIILQNVLWIQSDDFTFDKGSIKFQDKVEMIGENKKFVYSTICTSTITKYSDLLLSNNFTFSYDPNNTNQTLLEFEDSTSSLKLKNATLHTTSTGLKLTKGSLVIKNNSYLSTEEIYFVEEIMTGTYESEGITFTTYDYQNIRIGGITFGNDSTSEDFICETLAGATLHVIGGPLKYRNINSESWNMTNNTSILNIHQGAQLKLYQTLNSGNGQVFFQEGATIFKDTGKFLIGSTSIYK